MRTTLTLDADIADKLRTLSVDRKRSFKEIVNTALRRGLLMQDQPGRRGRKKFAVQAYRGGFRPAIDIGKLNQLMDDLEVKELGRKARTLK